MPVLRWLPRLATLAFLVGFVITALPWLLPWLRAILLGLLLSLILGAGLCRLLILALMPLLLLRLCFLTHV